MAELRKYRLSDQAAKEALDIYHFGTAQFGSAQAKRYQAMMTATFLVLAENPGIGRYAGDIADGLRRHPCGSHVVFYRARTGTIDVVRLIHMSRLRGAVLDDPA